MDLKPEDAEDEMESSAWTGSCSFTWSEARERQSLECFRPKCGGLLLPSAVWEVVGLEHSVWVGVPPYSPHRQSVQSSVPPKFLRGDSWGLWFHSYWLRDHLRWLCWVVSARLWILCIHWLQQLCWSFSHVWSASVSFQCCTQNEAAGSCFTSFFQPGWCNFADLNLCLMKASAKYPLISSKAGGGFQLSL